MVLYTFPDLNEPLCLKQFISRFQFAFEKCPRKFVWNVLIFILKLPITTYKALEVCHENSKLTITNEYSMAKLGTTVTQPIGVTCVNN